MATTFTARVAPSFDRNQPDCLFEVVTQDGERIASTTSELYARDLARGLNAELKNWVERVGADAVVA